jgi:hypothetical protein
MLSNHCYRCGPLFCFRQGDFEKWNAHHTKQGVCHTMAFPFTSKSILRQKKYFTMQKYNLQKAPLKETKILQDIITLKLISGLNTSQNIIFQKSS